VEEDIHATIGDVYERNEIAHDEQLTTRFQQLEEQFYRIGDQFEQFGDRMDALTEQFAAMGIANERHRQPNPHFAKEDNELSIEDEPVNPFAKHRARRDHPLVPNKASRWEARFKLDLPKFQCYLQPEQILD
jgi:hypothetical protein